MVDVNTLAKKIRFPETGWDYTKLLGKAIELFRKDYDKWSDEENQEEFFEKCTKAQVYFSDDDTDYCQPYYGGADDKILFNMFFSQLKLNEASLKKIIYLIFKSEDPKNIDFGAIPFGGKSLWEFFFDVNHAWSDIGWDMGYRDAYKKGFVAKEFKDFVDKNVKTEKDWEAIEYFYSTLSEQG